MAALLHQQKNESLVGGMTADHLVFLVLRL
jgi:hypothetical protein